ncbi:Polyphosphate kinase 2 (PPK2) [Poriferisphaera corsica]|uniref:Polyphosphate kinase 2 (PPK2) n=1 Tax=Poriferisphaera corsica TaxID=2528020 RepID=A0A517YQV4_9BACT|nr:PPK2 family polyphosphate kinase [Poriferisphaera corsica]QDU32585.1 Polyphosphate kinase 2 (PPK2) [Poriferisphaera corsica]
MTIAINTQIHRVSPQTPINLHTSLTTPPTDFEHSKKALKEQFKTESKALTHLQELMYAQSKHAVLIVFQAMDAGGKDSTIRHIMTPINPQGCRVLNFKAPSAYERERDYLWRIHQHVPPKGCFTVFNRSHYEDVVTVSVNDFAPKHIWQKRYNHINAFEQLLTDEGTHILKFFLHISKDYQKHRLQRRLDRPDKHWKFDPSDLVARNHWDDYMQAYAQAFNTCSVNTDAPWYVIPAENREYRNLAIIQIINQKLQSLDMQYPAPQYDASQYKIN